MSVVSTQADFISERTLREVAKMVGGEVQNGSVFIHNGQESRIPLPIPLEIFPTTESLRDRIALFHKEPNRAYKVFKGIKGATIAIYGAHYVVQATSSLSPLVNGLFAAKAIGYPLSDGMYGYASSEQLNMLKQVEDVEGIQIQCNKIKESASSFLGGVFFTASEAATGLGAGSLAAILSFAMLPLYAVGFGFSCKVQGKRISSSKQFRKDLFNELSLKDPSEKGWGKWLKSFVVPEISSANLSEENVKQGLRYLKRLITPKEQVLKEIIEELGKENRNESLIQKKLTEYKNEQFKKFQELERRVGSSAANALIDELSDVLAQLESGNLDEAQKLLATIEKGASAEIIKAAIAILVGLLVLAAFVAMTVMTHGAALSLLL